jgi:uncharacterized damage-inducible protein DinB
MFGQADKPPDAGEDEMTVKDLEVLYEYGYWANGHLFKVLSQLSPEQFTQSVAGSYGSIRNTLVHMLSAEWGWLDRCGGTARGPALNSADYPALQSVMDRWKQVEGYMRQFLSTLRDPDLDRPIEFALGSGPRHIKRMGQILHHSANHAAHHRGQISLLLRMLGYMPGNFDVLLFYPDLEA